MPIFRWLVRAGPALMFLLKTHDISFHLEIREYRWIPNEILHNQGEGEIHERILLFYTNFQTKGIHAEILDRLNVRVS